MTYKETLDFLSSLVDYSLIPYMDHAAEKFNLQRMFDLLALIGNPHLAYPVIHVGGTKGKGSTAVMMASVLRAAGYKVGLYTSPYLFDFCEQIQVNGDSIPQDELVRQVDAIKPFLDQVKGITTFEAVTCIGFHYFKKQNVDIAIIEVGFGGAIDATNVVRPAITVLSSISYDHTAIFGSTIKAIAESEAGIIKPGCPVVAAPQVFLDAKNVIIAKTTLEKSELLLIDEKCRFTEIRHSLDGQTFSIEFLDGEKKWNGQYKLSLLGRHQIENTTTALTALRRLTELGFVITKKKVQLGLQAVRWPCRFEVVSRHPLIVLDSAHNVDSAQKLKSTITKYLGDRKIILIFGASADKDIKGMFEVLLPGIQKVILTKSAHPRAAEPAMLVKLVSSGSVPFETTENINEAIEMAKRETDQKSAIVVAGSIFIAAAARQVIQNSQRQEIE